MDPESDRIVTAAVSLVGDGRPAEHFSWLLDPGVAIPAGATAVHGITTERAREEGRIAAEAIEEIIAVLARHLMERGPIVAFNARFDLTILDREAQRHGLRPLLERVEEAGGMLVVDPHVLDKQIDRFRRGKRTLAAVCEHYNIVLGEAHAANADALAAARLAFRLGARIAELGELELSLLHRQQILWAREQAISLEAYFRRQGSNERVEAAWPIASPGLARAA